MESEMYASQMWDRIRLPDGSKKIPSLVSPSLDRMLFRPMTYMESTRGSAAWPTAFSHCPCERAFAHHDVRACTAPTATRESNRQPALPPPLDGVSADRSCGFDIPNGSVPPRADLRVWHLSHALTSEPCPAVTTPTWSPPAAGSRLLARQP